MRRRRAGTRNSCKCYRCPTSERPPICDPPIPDTRAHGPSRALEPQWELANGPVAQWAALGCVARLLAVGAWRRASRRGLRLALIRQRGIRGHAQELRRGNDASYAWGGGTCALEVRLFALQHGHSATPTLTGRDHNLGLQAPTLGAPVQTCIPPYLDGRTTARGNSVAVASSAAGAKFGAAGVGRCGRGLVGCICGERLRLAPSCGA